MGSSRKRSKSPSPTHALHNHTFFLERSLDSRTFADALTSAGVRVERFFLHGLRPDAEDGVWIRYAAERQWVSLTADKDVGSTPDEIADVMENEARVLVLTFGKGINQPILAENFLRMAPKIDRFLRNHRAPYMAKINRPNEEDWELGRGGSIRMYRTYEEWLRNRHKRRD